jgi:uncharacterized protein YerC
MKTNRFLSLLLVVLMLASLASPTGVFAENIEESSLEEIAYEEPVYEELVYEEAAIEEPAIGESEADEIAKASSVEEGIDENALEEELYEDETVVAASVMEEELDVYAATALAITTQPEDYVGANGSTATFTVAAETSGTGSLSYQWQVSSNGTSWKNSGATGAKTATLSFVARAANSGYLYRCIVSDGTSEVITREAVLTVSALTITAEPEDYVGANGSIATFTVAAETSGTGSLSYQWQVSSNNGASWKNSGATGAKTATMSFVARAANSGYLYRCIVSDGATSITSREAILNVSSDIVVNNVVYGYLDDTTLFVKSYSGDETVLEIPQTINGLTVTQIGPDAFAGNTKLQSIDLPDTISVIGARAFKGCTNLSEMH